MGSRKADKEGNEKKSTTKTKTGEILISSWLRGGEKTSLSFSLAPSPPQDRGRHNNESVVASRRASQKRFKFKLFCYNLHLICNGRESRRERESMRMGGGKRGNIRGHISYHTVCETLQCVSVQHH